MNSKNHRIVIPARLLALLPALSILVCPSLATARIGETPAQITARYGPALKERGFVTPDGRFLTSATSTDEVHEKNGIYVSVRYIKGKCAWILYHKKAPRRGAAPTFSMEEMTTLSSVCAPNAQDLQTKDKLGGDGHAVFILATPDGSLFTRAATEDDGHTFTQLVAHTGEWQRQVDEADKASATRTKTQRISDAQKNLSGF